jgi:hypothetical protein
MQTTIHSHSVGHKTSKTESAQRTTLSSLFEKAETIRYGLISYLLMFLGCMGGIAAAFGAGSHPFELAAVVFPTILSLAFMLAVSPMRLILSMSAIALILDILVLLF